MFHGDVILLTNFLFFYFQINFCRQFIYLHIFLLISFQPFTFCIFFISAFSCCSSIAFSHLLLAFPSIFLCPSRDKEHHYLAHHWRLTFLGLSLPLTCLLSYCRQLTESALSATTDSTIVPYIKLPNLAYFCHESLMFYVTNKALTWYIFSWCYGTDLLAYILQNTHCWNLFLLSRGVWCQESLHCTAFCIKAVHCVCVCVCVCFGMFGIVCSVDKFEGQL